MYYRLKSITLMCVSLIFSLSLPVYGETPSHLLTQNPSSLAQNPTAETDKLFEQGVKLQRRGQYFKALEVYQRVLKLRRSHNDKVGIAQTLNNLGRVYISLLEKDKADKALQEALVIRRELKDRKGEGETLDNIGRVYGIKGEYKKALELLEQALAIRREVKDRKGEAKTLKMIGVVYILGFNKNAQALEFLQQALNIQEKVGDKYEASFTLLNIGRTYYFSKDYPRALEFLEKAKVLSREADNPVVEVLALQGIASVYSDKGNKNGAAEVLESALVSAQKNQLRLDKLVILNSLASGYNVSGKPVRARDLAQEAVNLARELNRRQYEAQALNILGTAYILLRDYQKAEAVLLEAVSITREIKNLDFELSTLQSLNLIYTQRGDFNKVIKNLLRQVEIAEEQNNNFKLVMILKNLASIYNNTGKHQNALLSYQQALATIKQIEISKLPQELQKFAGRFELDTLKGISFSYSSLGEYDKGLLFAQQTLKVAQSLNKPEYEVEALLHLALLYDATFNNYSKAIELSQQALSIAKQINQPEKKAEVLINLSGLYNKQRSYISALEYAQQALTIAKKINNPSLEFGALDRFREIYQKQGKYQKALEFAQQVYALVQQKKEHIGIHKGMALRNLSTIYLSLGDTIKAEETAKQALNLAQNRSFNEEASSLISLTNIYLSQGKYEQGIETAQKALEISRNNNYFLGEVLASLTLSEIYEKIGNYKQVITVAQPYLSQVRKINQRDKEAKLLINLGNAYNNIGNYTKGKQFIEQGLAIAKQLKNLKLESKALHALGSMYLSQNDYQKALELTKASLDIANKLNNPLVKPFILDTLGHIYGSLGDYEKSIDFYQQSLEITRSRSNRYAETIGSIPLSLAYFFQGKPEKTVELAEKALVVAREIKQPSIETLIYLVLSLGYGELGNDVKAMENAKLYLDFSRKAENSVSEKTAFSLLGMIHSQFGRNQEATKAYQQALAIQTPENVTGNNAGIYAGLGRVYRKLNQPNIAIGYYKQAINGIENIRRGIEGLPPQLQNSFLNAVADFKGTKTADIYRELAELLISQGRQAEARQVLDLLKIQEIRDFAGAKTDVTNPQVPLTNAEKRIQTESQSIIALSRRISECEKTNCKEKSQLNDRLTALLTQFNKDLDEIEEEISDRIDNDDAAFRPNSPKAAEIVKSQPDTVMIYPLVMEDKLWLLLYSGDAAKKFEVKVSRDELETTVKQFRKFMEECEKLRYCGADDIAKIKPVSEKLYSWLIKPLSAELKQNKVKNLVFALDRVTRYVPMSALYDGKRYLIENYTVYNVLSADLTDTTARLPATIQDTKVLAMGVSDAVGGFSALDYVPEEVDNIVKSSKTDKGVYPGKEYLNKSFDYKTLRDNLTGNNILHLATHGKFVPDNKKPSYLLLGNGEKLAIPQIQTLAGLSNIHLVVLSACQTALAAPRQDGVEIASLAYSFMNKGAKSVIASLWQVSDSSTSTLMQNFYNNLAKNKQKITKAEAMRLAQLQLLYNKDVSVDDIKRAGGLIPEETPSSGKKSESKTFAHPYYWAPFVLIGNGL